MAGRLRRQPPGARRQRRPPPAPARHLRRDHGHLPRGADPWPRAAGRRLAAAARSWSRRWRRTGKSPTAASGRCAARPALHLLQGDGLGRRRPGDQGGGELPPRRAGGAVAGAAPEDPRRRHPQWLRRPQEHLRPGLWRRGAGCVAAADPARRLPAVRRSQDHRHGRGGPAGALPRRPGDALPGRSAPTTACKATKARSSPARSGWSTPCAFSIDGRRRASCSSTCCRSATTSACWRRNTTSPAVRQVGNFPQAFSHVALVNSASNLTYAYGPARRRAGE